MKRFLVAFFIMAVLTTAGAPAFAAVMAPLPEPGKGFGQAVSAMVKKMKQNDCPHSVGECVSSAASR
ncbi:MAG: hypothetical protein M1379_01215 [Firmicutes bacterium]|nr:hypothetical protein [Bacillota bacterium]